MYVLGIDGGGSRTRALLCDASGQSIGQGLSGGINPRVTSEVDLRTHLREAIEQSTQGIDHAEIIAAHLGVAGVSDSAAETMITTIARECIGNGAAITVGHDLEIALVGGLGGKTDGIALVAGTGSACYGRNSRGQSAQCGGWGDLVDDVGSGSWFGLRALQACIRQADGRLAQSPLKEQVMHFLQIDRMEAFRCRIHDIGLSRSERAALAPVVLDLAVSGDVVATAIASEGADELCHLLASTSRQLQLSSPSVLLSGGLMKHAYFRALVENTLQRIQPEARIVEPRLTAVAGATLTALMHVRSNTHTDAVDNLS